MAPVTNRQSPVAGHQSSVETAPALLGKTWYWYYVLALLTICYVANVVDRSQVLAASLQAIKREFNATDAQLGILSGLPFAIFYSLLGIPLAAWADRSSRRNVLAWSCALWSAATGACGLALNFGMLFGARVATAIGEAGGSPPSHSLISDYFPKSQRGTAFSIFALGVPFGTAVGNFIAGWSNDTFGWRATFVIVGLPGLLLALIMKLTIREPPRGYADRYLTPTGEPVPRDEVPGAVALVVIEQHYVRRIIGPQPLPRHRIEALGKLRDAVAGHGDSGRRPVAAVTDQHLLACREPGVQIEGRNRSPRAASLLPRHGHQDDRSRDVFHQS